MRRTLAGALRAHSKCVITSRRERWSPAESRNNKLFFSSLIDALQRNRRRERYFFIHKNSFSLYTRRMRLSSSSSSFSFEFTSWICVLECFKTSWIEVLEQQCCASNLSTTFILRARVIKMGNLFCKIIISNCATLSARPSCNYNLSIFPPLMISLLV